MQAESTTCSPPPPPTSPPTPYCTGFQCLFCPVVGFLLAENRSQLFPIGWSLLLKDDTTSAGYSPDLCLISKPTHIVPAKTTIIPAKTTQNWQQKPESTYSLHSALWGKRVSDTPSQRGRSHPENIYHKHVSFLIPILSSTLFDSWNEKEQVTATCYIMNSINSVRHTRSSTQKCVW